MHRLLWSAAVVGAILVSTISPALGQSPATPAGTWKLNLEKSTYNPGPPPKNDTRTFDDRGGGTFVYTSQGANGQGQPTFNSWTMKEDGKDYPRGVNATGAKLSVAYRRVDAWTTEVIQKIDGK